MTGRPTPVLLLVRTLGHGGTERQAAEIARHLDRSQFCPHIVCHDASGFHVRGLREAGVAIEEIRVHSLWRPETGAAAGFLRRYIRQHGIVLVHAFDYPMVMFGVPTARWSGVPVVISSQRCHRDVIAAKYHWPICFAHWLAHSVVTNCAAVSAHLVSDYHVAARKIHVCYNSIEPGRFEGARVRRPELTEAAHVIGAVCVLRPEKGLAVLVDAFAAVAKQHAGLRLVLVGSGPELGSLRAQASRLGVLEACHFEPSTEDVGSWLRSIDIFVQPSYSEALSNSVMEAQASGCCVVASAVGGNPELVQHGRSGLLFAAGDSGDLAGQLRCAMGDTELREALGRQGAADVRRRFSREATVGCIEGLYRELLAAKAR